MSPRHRKCRRLSVDKYVADRVAGRLADCAGDCAALFQNSRCFGLSFIVRDVWYEKIVVLAVENIVAERQGITAAGKVIINAAHYHGAAQCPFQ